jgi:hypothetical protein
MCAVISHSNPVRSLFLWATSLSSDALHRAFRIAIGPKNCCALVTFSCQSGVWVARCRPCSNVIRCFFFFQGQRWHTLDSKHTDIPKLPTDSASTWRNVVADSSSASSIDCTAFSVPITNPGVNGPTEPIFASCKMPRRLGAPTL